MSKKKKDAVFFPKELATHVNQDTCSFAFTALSKTHQLYYKDVVTAKGEKILGEYVNGNKDRQETLEELNPLISQFRRIHSFDTGWFMETAVPEDMQGMVRELHQELVTSYEVTKVHEKYMLQVAAMSLARYQDNMRVFEEIKTRSFHDRVSFMSLLSKDMDRAYRTFMTIINHFDVLRSPRPSIHVHAKNAAVATNQVLQITPSLKSNDIHNDGQ